MYYIQKQISTNILYHFEKKQLSYLRACGLDKTTEITVGTVMFKGTKWEYFKNLFLS